MKSPLLPIALLILNCVITSAILAGTDADSRMGKFNPDKDLFIAQFDSKTDVDDIHSIAATATLLSDPRFAEVNYHAVAGAYGIQEGPYVPANVVFQLAFGSNWSDAHADFDQAVHEVVALELTTLQNGGNVWIAEAGQSDFSAACIEQLMQKLPEMDTRKHIHVVQHSEWNESVTAPEKLTFAKENSDYHKIPDGNAEGNGTPGFRKPAKIDWENAISDPRLLHIWSLATSIADQYNGVDGRYLNEAIKNGGLDFSDVSEACWIFGFAHLQDAQEFFKEFGTP